MSHLKKISISVPPALVDDLDFIAARMGVSRSAIISELLGESLSSVRLILEAVPANPEPADVRRMRGESADLVRERLSTLQGIADDLLSKL